MAFILTIKTAHGYLSATPPSGGDPTVPPMQYRGTAGTYEQFEIDGLDDVIALLTGAANKTLEATPVPPTPGPVPPEPGPAPPENPNHVGPGPAIPARAEEVVYATAQEFPWLIQEFHTDGEAEAHAEELLLRIIWHHHLAGFESARQRNPSGVISKDKLCVRFVDGWHVYDVMSLGYGGRATTMQWLEITGANPVPDNGIAD